MPTFPFIKQLNSADCGPTCIRTIAKYYGINLSASSINSKIPTTPSGMSLLELGNLAVNFGFDANAIKLDPDELYQITLPCILHWKGVHYVVLYKITKKYMYLADPATGLVKMLRDEFFNNWLFKTDGGIALKLEPTEKFYALQGSKNQKGIRSIYKYFYPYRAYFLMLILSMGVGMLFTFVLPFLTQAIVDFGITNQDLSFIQLILIAQLTLALGNTLLSFLKNWITLHVSIRVNVSLIADYLAKVMKLPISYIETKSIGDFIQRISDHSRIQNFASTTTLNLLFSFVNFIVYSFIMVVYSVPILIVYILGSVLYAGWVYLFLKRRKVYDIKMFEKSAVRQTKLIQIIAGIRDIKLFNVEGKRNQEWKDIQASLYRISTKQLSVNQIQQIGGFFIQQTKNIIVSYIAARSVINGEMTLGMMLAMQMILGQLSSPIMQIISMLNSLQDARLSFNRIAEIKNQENEEGLNPGIKTPVDFTGKEIRINDLRFSYKGENGTRVLNDLSITIPNQKITAIVGSSGSGKSTLLKILIGFYPFYEGTITIGGVNMKEVDLKEWRKSCGVVLQEGFIFASTIKENICMMDAGESANEIRMVEAAKMANIYEFISSLPNQFESQIGSEGVGVSQGQKQRILIARAIYRQPDFIFFDEATSSLDSSTESVIVDNLHSFFEGRTVLIIAHRLSTVKNADQIIVLENGQVVESGVHTDLISMKGRYYQLVKNQLLLN